MRTGNTQKEKNIVDIILNLDALLRFSTPEELAEIDEELRKELPDDVPLGSLERAVMLFLLFEKALEFSESVKQCLKSP